MTTIYLIRHAEADGNLYRIAQGQDNSNLTPRGWKQVALLQERFAATHIDAVYSSDLYRTCATASAIFQAKGLPLQRRRELREIYVGPWEGRTWGDIALDYGDALHAFTANAQAYHLDGGETLEEVERRVEGCVREIAAAHPDQTLAVFSHGYAIRLLLAKLQGYTLAQLDETPHGDNTAVSKLEVNADTITVAYRDDASHLTMLNQGKKRANAVEPGLYFRPTTPQEVRQTLGVDVDGGTLLLGRQVNGTPVGFLQLLDQGALGTFGLIPAMRGKGYGAQLLGQAVMACRKAGINTVTLSTALLQAPMDDFLHRYGFVQKDALTWEKSIAFDPRYL